MESRTEIYHKPQSKNLPSARESPFLLCSYSWYILFTISSYLRVYMLPLFKDQQKTYIKHSKLLFPIDWIQSADSIKATRAQQPCCSKCCIFV